MAQAIAGAGQGDVVQNPMYGVALLKIALELKKNRDRSFEAVVESVVGAMGFDRADFERFVAQNMGLLVTTAKARGY